MHPLNIIEKTTYLSAKYNKQKVMLSKGNRTAEMSANQNKIFQLDVTDKNVKMD